MDTKSTNNSTCTEEFQNYLDVLAFDTYDFAIEQNSNKLLVHNTACRLDTIIFVSYIIINKVFKGLNGNLEFTFNNEYKSKLIPLVASELEIDKHLVDTIFNDRFSFYNNQCKRNIDEIINCFEQAILYNKVYNKFDKIESLDTSNDNFINDVDFDVYLEFNSYISSYCKEIQSYFDIYTSKFFSFTSENNKIESIPDFVSEPIKQASKNQQNTSENSFFKRITSFIYNKITTILYLLIIPIVFILWLSPVSIGNKLCITIFLLITYPINLITNPIICAYLILSNTTGLWSITASIVSMIVLILNLLALLLNYIISKKKENKQVNTIYVSALILAILVHTSCSVYKTCEKYNNTYTQNYYEQNIKLISLTTYVTPGEFAHIKIQSTPNTEHEITVSYNSGESTAEGLINKYTNDLGYVDWTWKVGTNTSVGSYPISIYNYDTLDSETFYFTIQ